MTIHATINGYPHTETILDLDQFLVTEKIKIRRNNPVASCHSIIWPWHFPAELTQALVDKGQMIRLQAKDSLSFYDVKQIQLALLIQGSVKLVSSLARLKHRIIDLYFPGESLAISQTEADCLSPKLEAHADSFIYALSKKHFFELCRQYPELFEFFTYLKDSTLIKTQRHQLVLSNFSAQKKLAYFIVNACRKLNVNTRKEVVLALPMSRVDMSDYLNLSPETLCRTLQVLQSQGLIVSAKNKLIIPDFQTLLDL